MPDVYRYEWTGKRSGVTYRIDIAPADATPLGTPTIETLNDDAVRECKDFAWEYDRFPVGMATLLRPTLIFNVDRIPSTLQGWLMDTPVTHNVTPFGSAQATVSTGCAFTFYVNGSIVWYGAQDISTRVRPNLADNTIEIVVDDAFRLATKAITMTALRDATHEYYYNNQSTIKKKQYLVDLAWDDGGTWYKYRHYAGSGQRIWAVPRGGLFDLWEVMIQDAMNAITRRSITLILSASLQSMYGDLYEQRYSASDTHPGSAAGQIYLTPFICDAGDDTLTYSLYDEWERNYKSMFDLIVDMCNQSCTACALTHAGAGGQVTLYSHALLSNGLTTPYTATELFRDASPDLWGRVLQQAVMSYEFPKGDDYDKYDFVIQTGRNDETLTMPVVWNWTLSANGWEYEGDGMSTYDPPLNKFWYEDTLDIAGEIVRCHSWWAGDGSTVPIASPYTLSHTGGVGLGLVDQQSWGIMRQGAEYLYATFGQAALTGAPSVLTGKMDSTLPVSASLTMDFSPYYRPLTIDVPSFRSWLAIAPTTYYVVKWTGNLTEELAEVELYGQ